MIQFNARTYVEQWDAVFVLDLAAVLRSAMVCVNTKPNPVCCQNTHQITLNTSTCLIRVVQTGVCLLYIIDGLLCWRASSTTAVIVQHPMIHCVWHYTNIQVGSA